MKLSKPVDIRKILRPGDVFLGSHDGEPPLEMIILERDKEGNLFAVPLSELDGDMDKEPEDDE